MVSPEYRHRQLVADAWCASFFWPKTADTPEAITTDTIRRLEADGEALDFGHREQLDHLANQYQFFHWQLAFPEVFARGGFDCVLGNPPYLNAIQQKDAGLSNLKPFWTSRFESAQGAYDLYVLFLGACANVAQRQGAIRLTHTQQVLGGPIC